MNRFRDEDRPMPRPLKDGDQRPDEEPTYEQRLVNSIKTMDELKTTPPTRQFSDGWLRAYQSNFKIKYLYQTKDAVAAARILKTTPPEELLATAQQAWKQTDDRKFWNCVHHSKEVASFIARLNAIRRELLAASPEKRIKICH